MIVATTDLLADRKIVRTLGLVRGSSVRGRHVGTDLMAWMRNTVGGEIQEYTKILSEVREQALDRMLEEARELGADAVVGVRFATSEIASGAAEMVIYGTAVKTAPVDD